jgi:hypothetical protein
MKINLSSIGFHGSEDSHREFLGFASVVYRLTTSMNTEITGTIVIFGISYQSVRYNNPKYGNIKHFKSPE